MKRVLSSPSLQLLFFPRLCGGVLGTFAALSLLARLQPSPGSSHTLIVIAVSIVLTVTAIGIKDCYAWRRLKKVALDDHFLYVSDYSNARGITIPLRDIVRVTQRRGKTLRTVTIHLRTSSEFGGRIQFQPLLGKSERGWAWEENKVVQELRRVAHIQTTTVSGR